MSRSCSSGSSGASGGGPRGPSASCAPPRSWPRPLAQFHGAAGPRCSDRRRARTPSRNRRRSRRRREAGSMPPLSTRSSATPPPRGRRRATSMAEPASSAGRPTQPARRGLCSRPRLSARPTRSTPLRDRVDGDLRRLVRGKARRRDGGKAPWLARPSIRWRGRRSRLPGVPDQSRRRTTGLSGSTRSGVLADHFGAPWLQDLAGA